MAFDLGDLGRWYASAGKPQKSTVGQTSANKEAAAAESLASILTAKP